MLVLLTPAKFVCAQYYWGLKAGISQNSIQTDISNRAFTETRSMTGYQVGLILKYEVKNWLSVQADPNIISKNYSIDRTGNYAGIYQSYKNTYLQLPVSLQVNTHWKSFNGFLSAGIYGAYWGFGKTKGTVPNILDITDSIGPNGEIIEILEGYTFSEKYRFDKRRDRRFEFGWLADVGVGYLINKKYNLFIEGRYYYSLTDMQKLQSPKYNETFSISVGLLIPFR